MSFWYLLLFERHLKLLHNNPFPCYHECRIDQQDAGLKIRYVRPENEAAYGAARGMLEER